MGESPACQTSKRKSWALGAILLGAVAIRLALICYNGMMYSWGDELEYVDRALAVCSGYGFQQIVRPPVFYYFLALLFLVFGPHVIVLGYANIAFHVGSIIYLYLIGREIYGRRVGLVAAGIYSFYPPFIMFVQYGYPINMTVLILLIVVWFIVDFNKKRQFPLLGWAGFFAAFSGLTYESMVFCWLPLVLGIYAVCRGKKMQFIKAASWFLVAFSLTAGVWMVRNYVVTRHFFLRSISYRFHLWKSHNTLIHLGHDYRIWEIVEEPCEYPKWDVEFIEGRKGTTLENRPHVVGPDPVEDAQREATNAFRFILDHPSITLKRIRPKLSVLWSPTPWALQYLMNGYYGFVDKSVIRGIVLLCIVAYSAIISLGILGLVFSPSHGIKTTLILFIAFISLLYSFAIPMTRCNPPLIPIFALYSAYALCNRKSIMSLEGKRLRWIAVAFLYVILLILWMPHIKILDRVFKDPFPEKVDPRNKAMVMDYIQNAFNRPGEEYKKSQSWREEGQLENF